MSNLGGQDYFLNAMAKVIKVFPNTKILIVGEPSPSTQRNQLYWLRLQQMVTNLGLSHRVIFTGFRRDIPQIMKVSNVIVHSASKPEPLGRVVAEAMMAGRPVIATNAGGVVDSVINDFNGKLVPLKDASAMAEAICDLLADQVLAQRLGQQAQQFVKKRFSVKKHVEAIQNIYSNILNEKASFTSKTHILKS